MWALIILVAIIVAIIDFNLSPPGAFIILVRPGKNIDNIPIRVTINPTIIKM